MPFPDPTVQDLQQLLITLDDKYALLEAFRARINDLLPEVQYNVRDAKARLYNGLCSSLSAQVGQYARLRRLVILPYLKDLQDKEDDGHDCRTCGGRCSIQHISHISSIKNAHTELKELLDHLQPAALALSTSETSYPEAYNSLFKEMMEFEWILKEVLFIEESALIPLMIDLQRKIGAYE